MPWVSIQLSYVNLNDQKQANCLKPFISLFLTASWRFISASSTLGGIYCELLSHFKLGWYGSASQMARQQTGNEVGVKHASPFSFYIFSFFRWKAAWFHARLAVWTTCRLLSGGNIEYNNKSDICLDDICLTEDLKLYFNYSCEFIWSQILSSCTLRPPSALILTLILLASVYSSRAHGRKLLFALQQIDSLTVGESYTKQAPFINRATNTVPSPQSSRKTACFSWYGQKKKWKRSAAQRNP